MKISDFHVHIVPSKKRTESHEEKKHELTHFGLVMPTKPQTVSVPELKNSYMRVRAIMNYETMNYKLRTLSYNKYYITHARYMSSTNIQQRTYVVMKMPYVNRQRSYNIKY